MSFKLKQKNRTKRYLFARISHLDKLLFAKHLAIMIKAGLPLKDGLGLLKDQTRSRTTKKILKQVKDDLENGLSLAASLKKHQRLFGSLFVSLIEIGETSGSLEESLSYLAIQLEKTYDLRKKIQAAAVYPALILAVSLLLGSGLVFLILPRLIPLFEGLHIALPWSTRLILGLAHFVKAQFWLLLGVLIFILISMPLLLRWRPIRMTFHGWLLKLPLINNLLRAINLAYFSRILGVLLKGGIPVAQALKINAQATRNLVYQEHIHKVASFVEKGQSISDYLVSYPRVFPQTISQLIKAAETSGKLEETLFYLAEFYEKESSRRLDDLSNVLGPILLLIIGMVVTLLALGIVTPIYQMTRGLTK